MASYSVRYENLLFVVFDRPWLDVFCVIVIGSLYIYCACYSTVRSVHV